MFYMMHITLYMRRCFLSARTLCLQAKYLTDEVKDKTGKSIDVTSWEQEYVTDLPNQENGCV